MNGNADNTSNKRLSRRQALSKATAAAMTGIGVAAGLAGFLAGSTQAGGNVRTVTQTLGGATVTQTRTVTQTVNVGAQAEPVTVKVNWWPGGPEQTAVEAIIARWNRSIALDTGITLEPVFFGRENHVDKITSILLSRSSELDIVFEFYLVSRFAEYLEPLDDYFKDERLFPYTLEDFIPASLDQFKVNGRLMGIPTDWSVHVLFYRKDLIPKPPETIDELVETARSFTKKINPNSPTDYGFIVSGKNLLFNAMLWESLLASAGGVPFEVGKERDAVNNLTSEAAQKALEVYTTFMKEGISPPDSITYEFSQANEAYTSGKAAMMIQWNAASFVILDPNQAPLVHDKTGVAPIPGERVGGRVLHRSHAHYLGFSINKFSQHKKEAFKFLAYFTTTRALLDYALGGAFPPARSVLYHPKFLDKYPGMRDIVEILDKYGFTMTNHPEVFTIYEILAKHISSAWSGNVSVKDALSNAQSELAGLLRI